MEYIPGIGMTRVRIITPYVKRKKQQKRKKKILEGQNKATLYNEDIAHYAEKQRIEEDKVVAEYDKIVSELEPLEDIVPPDLILSAIN